MIDDNAARECELAAIYEHVPAILFYEGTDRLLDFLLSLRVREKAAAQHR